MTTSAEFTNRCACGWEVTGPEDEVVDATIDHGRRIHNMEATREQVLEAAPRARRATGGDATATARRPPGDEAGRHLLDLPRPRRAPRGAASAVGGPDGGPSTTSCCSSSSTRSTSCGSSSSSTSWRRSSGRSRPATPTRPSTS